MNKGFSTYYIYRRMQNNGEDRTFTAMENIWRKHLK